MSSNPKTSREASATERSGEAAKAGGGGSDLCIALSSSESLPQEPGPSLIEQVCSAATLARAKRQVCANRGCAGIDGIRTEEIDAYLATHWVAVREQLLTGTYKPQAVKQVMIPKPQGGERKLGIPTVIDRIIQQALLIHLEPYWEPHFSPYSYGFRPKRNCHQAVRQVKDYIAEGYTEAVDIDLEKFFDRVNHDKLMSEVAKRIKDKKVLKLIRGYLNSGIMSKGIVSRTEEGVPQGGPLSPLLSNIMLDLLDQELTRRGLKYVRYADDCLILVRTKRAAERVMESVIRFIETKLKLKVNRAKSEVAPYRRCRFLGFGWIKRKGRVLIRVSQASIKKLKDTLRTQWSISSGTKSQLLFEHTTRYLNGWYGYYGLTNCPQPIEAVEKWLRRRCRALAWQRWKTPRNRYRKLRSLGVPDHESKRSAASSKGAWRMSKTPAVQRALCNRFFAKHLPSLASYRQRQHAKAEKQCLKLEGQMRLIG